ncbi:hypothetical protein F751_2702 [Auxenochlorella protothecoides]|uniref:Uncharacterized protein n=1 Tax=Auxenochlorella protothecoides TaxID=3075 RepID=A0A087SL80_AUXPR|nr:hypothetical protein F751_2702 [Auxenochlorella protothecoides]KFM26484.1 hypothetical protein F751_2702 [Auxenochlorella protothecoides]
MSNPAGSPPAPGLDEENSVINELNNLALKDRDVEEWAERLKPAVPPYVRWVDETAAVLVFFDPPAARAAQRAAAASSGPTLGTLPVARRLIGAALSMNLRDKGKEEALRDAGRAKREARVAEQARRAALDAAWE